MNNIGARLREIRTEKGLTQIELAKQLQCGAKAISRYEKNENLDKVYDFIQICECLGEVNYIITGKKSNNGKEITQHDQQILSAYHSLNNSDKQKIVDFILEIGEYNTDKAITSESTTIYHLPVFRQEAAAGVGRLDVNDGYYMENFVVDNIPKDAVFVMKIAGDSMYNEKTNQIKDNAIVVINPRDTIYKDKIVIVNLDGEIVCKRYSKVDDHVEFKSDNNLRQDEDKDSRSYREPKVIGVVLGVIENEKFIPVK